MNTMNIIGKGRKTAEQMLKRAGYNYITWIAEESVLDCAMNHAGVCIKSCEVTFSPKGRAVSVEEKSNIRGRKSW